MKDLIDIIFKEILWLVLAVLVVAGGIGFVLGKFLI